MGAASAMSMAPGVLGAGGQLVGGLMASSAAKKAAGQQAAALQQILTDTANNLDPNLVNAKATAADIQRAKARLALQGEVDPQLLAQRQLSEQILSGQLGQIGKAASDQVAAQTMQEALAGVPGLQQGGTELVSQANDLLRQGATLPPDVQAALMQAGLEQTGAVTGTASARGAGGAILQQVLGMGGLQLQQQRQQQAAALMSQASNLEATRQQILQNLFPKLQQQQLSNISATSGILQQSNNMLPQAGLSGSDVASIWLQRQGALNQIAGQIAGVRANGTLTSGLLTAGAVGAAAGLGQGGAANLGTQYLSAYNGGGGGGGSSPNLSSFFNTGGGNAGASTLSTAASGGGYADNGMVIPSIGG